MVGMEKFRQELLILIPIQTTQAIGFKLIKQEMQMHGMTQYQQNQETISF